MGFLDKLFKKNTPPDSAQTMSRNATCWCGSGKKYKLCHHDSDRTYFAGQINAAACKGPT